MLIIEWVLVEAPIFICAADGVACRRWGQIIYLLTPYYANIGKRLIKSPKLYFIDTGLAAYLAGITESRSLLRGPLAGQLFETFVVSEFVKSFYAHGERPNISFINNKNIWEIDLLLERNRVVTPLEIKLSATITGEHLKNFSRLCNSLTGLAAENYVISNQRERFFRQGTHVIHWGAL